MSEGQICVKVPTNAPPGRYRACADFTNSGQENWIVDRESLVQCEPVPIQPIIPEKFYDRAYKQPEIVIPFLVAGLVVGMILSTRQRAKQKSVSERISELDNDEDFE